MLELLGLTMIYAWIHFIFIQVKSFNERNKYEKIVTWFAIITYILYVIGTINN